MTVRRLDQVVVYGDERIEHISERFFPNKKIPNFEDLDAVP